MLVATEHPVELEQSSSQGGANPFEEMLTGEDRTSKFNEHNSESYESPYETDKKFNQQTPSCIVKQARAIEKS